MAAMEVHLTYSKEKKMQGLDSNNWEKRKTRNQLLLFLHGCWKLDRAVTEQEIGDFYSWWREKKRSGKKKSKNGSTHREKRDKKCLTAGVKWHIELPLQHLESCGVWLQSTQKHMHAQKVSHVYAIYRLILLSFMAHMQYYTYPEQQ